MKKRIVCTLPVLMALVMATAAFLAGCEKKEQNGFIIATDTTFAPFVFQNEQSTYVGIDVDVMSAIASDQGFSYTLTPLGFSAAVAAVEAGQADGIIAGMSITDERRKVFDFSEPYFDSGVVMAIRADNTEITGYNDLNGRTVAIKIGTEGATFAESIMGQYGFTLQYFDESPFMYEAVMVGHAAACFEDFPVMSFGINQGNGLKIVTPMEKGSSYGFAVRRGQNQELLRMFNQGLANIKANGIYQEILDRYLSAE